MFHKRYPPIGSQPGTLAVDTQALETRIHVMKYDHDGVEDFDILDVEHLEEVKKFSGVSWIDVQGLGNAKILEQIASIFEIHPLAIADVVNVPGRPKVEDYEGVLLIITNMVSFAEYRTISVEQVSIILGKNFVITFQEDYDDILNSVRQRVRQGRGSIRKSGSDYLAYALIDALIDGYFPVLENLGEHLEEIEDQVIEHPSREVVRSIYKVKRELLKLRRSIWPQREMLHALINEDSKLFKKTVRPYLRDCHDHAVQIIDVIETYRELCGGFTDLYLSSTSNRLNEVMKMLTVISTIFIPLSFLASIYGMNFEYMPELKVTWAYPAFLGSVFFIALLMLYYFYQKGWLHLEDNHIAQKE